MIRVWGIAPEDKVIRRYAVPSSIPVLNMGAAPDTDPAVLEESLAPANRPMELRSQLTEEILPELAEDCTTVLLAALEGLVEAHTLEEKRLRKEVDEPDLQECLKQASLLYDADAQRVKRSTAEAASRYHRAHKALFETLRRDAEEAEAEHEADEGEGEEGEEASSATPKAWVKAGVPVAPVATPDSQNEIPGKARSSPQLMAISGSSGDGPVSEEA